jgi:23S rRNA-/tRNA-specific pseudouridylate synthase
MSQPIHLTGITEPHHAGKRLDQVVAELFTDYSRTRLKDWILAGKVQLDGNVILLPKEKVMEGQNIEISAELEDDTRGHNNNEMMGRLKNYLDTHFSNSSDKVLLNNRKK